MIALGIELSFPGRRHIRYLIGWAALAITLAIIGYATGFTDRFGSLIFAFGVISGAVLNAIGIEPFSSWRAALLTALFGIPPFFLTFAVDRMLG